MVDFPVSHVMQNGEMIRFDKFTDFVKFMSSEEDFIQVLVDHGLDNTLSDQDRSLLRQFIDYAERISDDRPLDIQRMKDLISGYFLIPRWPHVGSFARARVDEILQQNDAKKDQAQKLFQVFNEIYEQEKTKNVSQIGGRDTVSLLMQIAKLRSDVDSVMKAIDDQSREISSIPRPASEFLAMLERGNRVVADLESSLSRAKSQTVRFAIKGKSEYESIKSAYLQSMELQAPIDYWKKKAENHEDRQSKLMYVLFIAAVSVIALPVGALWAVSYGWIPSTSLPSGSPEWAVILGPAKGLVAAVLTSAVSIWALRIVSKIYLSERHLAQDARERVTMTTTYLALIKERAASESDRSIILQALFRNTSDGIVKDDGGVDPSALGLLSKLLERKT